MKKFYSYVLAVVVAAFTFQVNAQLQEADSLALVDIYNAGDGANWTNVENPWLQGNADTWSGVIVTEGRVTELYLNQINFGGIGGELSPSIGNLTELTRFEIQDAPTLRGSIPSELWNCTKIGRLQMKYTGLTGGIPAGIESMVNMYEINFQQSYLGGSIPAEVFQLPSLTKAYLHQSNFTGTVPSTVTEAKGLVRLYLQDNHLEGPLPFADIPADNGAKVNLTGNYFSFEDVKPYHDAAANSQFASFTNDYQYAQASQFFTLYEGDAIDFSLTVEDAAVYNWFFNEEAAPVTIGNNTHSIASATEANAGLYTCKIQSSLVSNFEILAEYTINSVVSSEITALEADSLALVDIYYAGDGANWMDVENAWLEGNVDTWTGVVVTDGRVTELGLNQINFGGHGGTLSPSIGKLTGLTRFEIQNAPNLNGSIPAEVWNCTEIGRLQMKYTGLTGGIPEGIESMVNIYEINFQQSYLGGSIPAEVFQLPSLTKAYLHQSNFTGKVPSTVTEATGLVRLYLHDNLLEGELPFANIPADNGAKVNLTGNYFSFQDVKPYHDAAANGQFGAFTNDYQYAQAAQHYTVNEGEEVSFSLTVDDAAVYNWFFNDEVAPVTIGGNMHTIASASAANEGVYTCKIQSSLVSSFEILAEYIIDEVTLSTSVKENEALTCQVYPNPFSDQLTIEVEAPITSVSLFNSTGNMVFNEAKSGVFNVTISSYSLKKGIYIIKVETEAGNIIKKVIKK